MKRLFAKRALAASVLLLLGFVRTAAASPFVVQDWRTGGDGLVTLDPLTNLEWLDITATAGRSYNDVSSRLGSGAEFSGWRYATDGEVTRFFTDAGLTVGFSNNSLTNNTNALDLLRSYYGYTNPSGDYYLSFQGLLNGTLNAPGNVTRGVVEGYQYDIYGGSPNANVGVNWNTFTTDSTHWSVGSMLVRSSAATVPEPATGVLIGSGLSAFVIRTRRRRKRRERALAAATSAPGL